MEIVIKGKPKEIAALIFAVQEQQGPQLLGGIQPYAPSTGRIGVMNGIFSQDTGGKG